MIACVCMYVDAIDGICVVVMFIFGIMDFQKTKLVFSFHQQFNEIVRILFGIMGDCNCFG